MGPGGVVSLILGVILLAAGFVVMGVVLGWFWGPTAVCVDSTKCMSGLICNYAAPDAPVGKGRCQVVAGFARIDEHCASGSLDPVTKMCDSGEDGIAQCVGPHRELIYGNCIWLEDDEV